MAWLLPYIAGIGAVIAALGAAWLGGRKSAKLDAKVDAQSDTIKAHEVRNEVDNRVAAEHDARDRLRSDWRR